MIDVGVFQGTLEMDLKSSLELMVDFVTFSGLPRESQIRHFAHIGPLSISKGTSGGLDRHLMQPWSIFLYFNGP